VTQPYVDPATVHVPSPGTSPPASWGTVVRSDLEFLVRRPGAKARRIAPQTIPAGAWTSVEFTGPDDFDTDAFHDTGSSSQVFTVPTSLGGWYDIRAAATFAPNATGNRAIRVVINGVTTYQAVAVDASQVSGGQTGVTFSEELFLAAGDTFEVQVYQQAGADLDILNARASARFSAFG
jgi:hypothetical protein